MRPSQGMLSFALMSNTSTRPPPPRGEYTLAVGATKAALCLQASGPQCCFYETWLARVRLGRLVLAQLEKTQLVSPLHLPTRPQTMRIYRTSCGVQ